MSKRERFKLSLSVFLFLIQDNKVLLIKRGNTGWMDGFYSVPAGALDGNETIESAVVREAREETGVEVDVSDIKLAHTIHCLTHGEEWLGCFFITNKWIGEPKIMEPDKHTEVKWSNIDQLPSEVIPYVKQALDSVSMNIPYSSYGWEVTK